MLSFVCFSMLTLASVLGCCSVFVIIVLFSNKLRTFVGIYPAGCVSPPWNVERQMTH